MSHKVKNNKIYPGWLIVITSVFLMGIAFAATINLPGLFTTYVTDDLGFGRTAFTTHITICTLSSIVAALIVGKVFQKYDVKKTMILFVILMALGFAGYSISTTIWHFYICSIVVGFSCIFVTSVPISILITNWFGPKLRGKAMGIAMTGSGIGAMILNPTLNYINSIYSWKLSYILISILLVLLIPMIAKTIRRSPEECGLEKKGAIDDISNEDALVGLTARQALGSVMFWLMMIVFLMFSLTTSIFNISGTPYFIDLGFAPVKAGTMMAIASFTLILGKLILGAACDKWGVIKSVVGTIVVLIIGQILLILTSSINALGFIAAILIGLGGALGTITMPLITGELFGNKDFGVLFGYASIGGALGIGLGAMFGAVAFDISGSYIPAWIINIALMAVMTFIMFLAYRLKTVTYQKIITASKSGVSCKMTLP